VTCPASPALATPRLLTCKLYSNRNNNKLIRCVFLTNQAVREEINVLFGHVPAALVQKTYMHPMHTCEIAYWVGWRVLRVSVYVRTVVARCRSVGTDDVRTGAVRRRSAGKARLLPASWIPSVSAAQLFITAVRGVTASLCHNTW